MAIVISILLFAAGVVVLVATDGTVGGLAVSTLAVILLVAGGIGVVASLLFSARAASERRVPESRASDLMNPVEEEVSREGWGFGRRPPHDSP